MPIGLIGRKCGMTRIFSENNSEAVSVIEVSANIVTQLKTTVTDGYCAVQVTTGTQKANRISKPLLGHYKKAGVAAGKGLWEFRLQTDEEVRAYSLGHQINVSLFSAGQKINVTGISKGKGFTGVRKRHNFKSQRASHGNSLSHNVPGSIGQNQTPGRVFKGKKMAGQSGNTKVTIQNLEIIKVDPELNVLLVKGAIPGTRGGSVIINSASWQ